MWLTAGESRIGHRRSAKHKLNPPRGCGGFGDRAELRRVHEAVWRSAAPHRGQLNGMGVSASPRS
jgi:hypothetical protein